MPFKEYSEPVKSGLS